MTCSCEKQLQNFIVSREECSEMIKELWEKISEEIDLTGCQVRGAHPFSRPVALQQVFIAAQNILFVSRDLIKRHLDKECEFMPWEFEEVGDSKNKDSNLPSSWRQRKER